MTTKTMVKRAIRDIETFLREGMSAEQVQNWREGSATRIDPRSGVVSDGRVACACCAAGTADPSIPGTAGIVCFRCIDMANRVEGQLGIAFFPPGLEWDPEFDPEMDETLCIEPEALLHWRQNLIRTIAFANKWQARPDVALQEWQQMCDYDASGAARAFIEMTYCLAPHIIDFEPRIAQADWLISSVEA